MASNFSAESCLSLEEKKMRTGINIVNALIWLILICWTIASMGILLIIAAAVWLVWLLLSEFNIRLIQATGTMVSHEQFPQIATALNETAAKFDLNLKNLPRVVVVNSSTINAFAVRFAKKKAIVLLSAMVEGILEKPAELRFILGHELGHAMLDYGPRGVFEIYKPAPYRAAREMTCDNCGAVAAHDQAETMVALKRLCVGNILHPNLNVLALTNEAKYIYSGFTGWLVKQGMNYPSMGKRIENVTGFMQTYQGV